MDGRSSPKRLDPGPGFNSNVAALPVMKIFARQFLAHRVDIPPTVIHSRLAFSTASSQLSTFLS